MAKKRIAQVRTAAEIQEMVVRCEQQLMWAAPTLVTTGSAALCHRGVMVRLQEIRAALSRIEANEARS